MNRFTVSSLRFRLLLLVFLAVLPALGLAVDTGLRQRRTAADQARDEALRLARAVAANQDQYIESAQQLLLALAQLPQVRNGDAAACSALLADLLSRYPRYSNLGVTDAQGDLFCSALPLSSPVNLADRAWFQRAVETHSFAVGDYQIGRLTREATVNPVYPILDSQGNVQMVLFAGLRLSWLNQLAADMHLPAGTTLTVFDQNGTVLVRYPDVEEWIGKSAQEWDLLHNALVHGEEGSAQAAGLAGGTYLFGYTPLGSAPGRPYVSVGIPSALAFAEANAILARNVLWLAVVGVLAIIAAWLGGDLFVLRQLKALLTTTRRLTAGDLSARSGLGHDGGELGELARAVDDMAGSLERRIAEQDRAEQRLRESESRLRTIFLAAPIGIALVSDRVLRYVNEHFCHILGYAEQELVNQSVRMLYDSEDEFQRIGQIYYTDLARQGTAITETRFRRQDGSPVGVLLSSAAIDPTDLSQGITATILDITEAKKAQAAVRLERDRAQQYLDVVQVILVALDDQGRITLMNRKGYEILGYEEGELHGQSWFDTCLPARVQQETRDIFQWLMAGGVQLAAYQENLVVTRSGQERLIAWRNVLLTDEDDRTVGMLSSGEDITERRQAEQELAAHREHLEELVAQRTAELEARNRELDTFAYSVSHDLKAPLRGIDGYSRLLLEERAERLDEEGRGFLHTIRHATDQMNQLIDDLLAYSRLQRRPLTEGTIDLRPFLEALVAERQDEIDRRRIELTLDVNCGSISTDANGLAEALRNLLDNALKFTRQVPAPRIEIGGRDADNSCLLWVRDNGIGFDMRYHDRIFEIFQRLHRAEDYPGTGIGLAIVFKAVQRMGGRAFAQSAPGEGATFYVELPR